MINISYNDIVDKIKTSTSLTAVEIDTQVDQKLNELNGLISKEGAAHIVANNLNVKLFESLAKIIKVGNLKKGDTSVTLLCKIISVNGIREYNSNGKKGRMMVVLVADETGVMRVVVWDDNLIEQMKEIREGDILKIKNGYCRENNFRIELHVGNKSQILINPENETIETVKIKIPSNRKQISSLQENEFVEVVGTIVSIFEPKFYPACPHCSKKVIIEGEAHLCTEHGPVISKEVPLISFFIDDGTGNVRAVCFRDQVEKLMGAGFKENFEELKKDTLGKQFSVQGRVVRNDMFDRVEFLVSSLEEAKPEELIKEIEK